MPLIMSTATLLLADMHSVASAVRSSAGESPSDVLALRMNRLVTLCIFVVSSSRFFAEASKLSTKRSVSAFCLLMLYRKCVAICPSIVPTSVGRGVVLFVEKGGGNPGGSSGVGFCVWEALVGGLKGAVVGWEKGVVVCGVSSTSISFGRVVSMVSVLRWLSSFCCIAGWNETWGLPVREMSGAGPVGDGSFGGSLLVVSFCVACFFVVVMLSSLSCRHCSMSSSVLGWKDDFRERP